MGLTALDPMTYFRSFNVLAAAVLAAVCTSMLPSVARGTDAMAAADASAGAALGSPATALPATAIASGTTTAPVADALAPAVAAPTTVSEAKPVNDPIVILETGKEAATPAAPAPVPAQTVSPEAILNGAALSAAPADASDEPSDLWERIRRGFRMPELTGPLVKRTENYYASKPAYVDRMTERASRYLYHIVEEIERRNMPTEIALLPFIESAFNPQAMSKAKASGMWQFIPGTGKIYGLKQNMFLDERRDVLESTRAALDYLTKLHDMFGDWHLALAAYNWGEGAVQRAIAKNQKRGKPTDYASLNMPGETRLYVPKLQAVKNIIANPAQFNLELPPVENEEYFTTITKNRDIDVETAARFAGMSVDEFRALNPSFNKPVIVGATMPQLILPKDKAEQFLANLDFAQGSLSSYTTHRVQGKETLETIATRFDTTPAQLRDINGIPSGARLRVGATLLVPKLPGVEGDIPADVAESAALVYEPGRTVKRVGVKVRKGESLASLAKRQRVSVAQLAQWNGFATSTRLQAGQTVFIERVVSPTRTRTASTRKHSTRSSRHAAAGRPGRAQASR